MASEAFEVLDLAAKKFDSFQTLWTIYSTVAFGVLGYVAAAPQRARSVLVSVILAVAFGAFAYANYQALDSIRQQRDAIREIATERVKSDKALDPTAKEQLLKVADAPGCTAGELFWGHRVSDALVILSILLLPYAWGWWIRLAKRIKLNESIQNKGMRDWLGLSDEPFPPSDDARCVAQAIRDTATTPVDHTAAAESIARAIRDTAPAPVDYTTAVKRIARAIKESVPDQKALDGLVEKIVAAIHRAGHPNNQPAE